MKRFTEFRSHKAASRAARCPICQSRLDGRARDEGYARGHGQFSQRCAGRCGMKFFYDLARASFPVFRAAA